MALPKMTRTNADSSGPWWPGTSLLVVFVRDGNEFYVRKQFGKR